ncbi:protein NTM1-like 9 [Populus alba]|nr:protein NTM1-like 9 [Populus alba]KAJ6972658.1 protein NTM1-like 9 [Populus alba x Populus x berolinensis]
MHSLPPPVGYGFHPTDEELVNHYLRFKMHGGYEQEVGIIAEANVCDYEPWVLPELSAIQEPNDPECYFFCPRSYKYANSHRANRTTQAGYWKVTGKDRIVKAKTTKEHIATKKTLVFYTVRVPNGIKTNWIMHEYHPNFSFPNQREFVLCKLKKDPGAIMQEGEASFNVTSNHCENENPNEDNHPQTFEEGEYGARTASNFTNEPKEDTDQFEAHLASFLGYDERCYSLDSALQFPHGDMY